MNRRQFIAGLAASTAPMVGVGAPIPVGSDFLLVKGVERYVWLETSNQQMWYSGLFEYTKEAVVDNVMNSGDAEEGRETLHDIS